MVQHADEVGMTNTNETAAPRLIMFQQHQQKPKLSGKHYTWMDVLLIDCGLLVIPSGSK